MRPISVILGIILVPMFCGCGTPEVIKQNTYHGVQATDTAISLLPADNPALPHLKAARACWIPVQIWTGMPENPTPYSPEEAITNSQLAKIQAEWQTKFEKALAAIPNGQLDWEQILMLVLGGTAGGGILGYPVARQIRKKITKTID